MSVGNELDLNTLSWVKSEIDETLNQARSALEVFAEDVEDQTQLQFCKNYLHQVRGTLQMVELYGAALAAEEMEVLCQALIDGKVNNRNDALEVLMRGILQLPDYLEHLLAGHRDMPMVLMPLLNDLRASRGEALLSENALFSPDLAVKAPQNDVITGENLSELARKLRHNYHLGLLGWFRDQDNDASLGRIADVIEQLRESATEEEINRLLWVASGLIESLRQGGLDSSVSIKLLLGQLDRQIKKIIDNGVTALSHEPPSELLKNLLYYVASSASDGERTRELKQAFRLADALPDTHTLEQARADLSGPNAQLMDTVSSVLMDDLLKVKDNLDVFVRAEQRDVNDLKPLSETLKQMADTLAMLGLGIQRNVVNEQVATLTAMLNGERPVEESALMEVADAMLSLEMSLSEASTARAANVDVDEAGADAVDATQRLQDAGQQKLLQTVIEESKVELARVKEAISDFSKNMGQREVLQPVPAILDQIKGSLTMLNLGQAGGLLEQCNSYIRDDLIANNAATDMDALENLADAISSIEYYLESLAGKWGQPEAILSVAEQSLAKLNKGSAGAAPVNTPPLETAPLEDHTQPDLAIPDSLEGEPVDENTLVDIPLPEGGELPGLELSLQSEDEDTLTDITDAGNTELPEPLDDSATSFSELSLESADDDDAALDLLEIGSLDADPSLTLSTDPFADTGLDSGEAGGADETLSLSIEGMDDDSGLSLDMTESLQQPEGLSLDNPDVSFELEGFELADEPLAEDEISLDFDLELESTDDEPGSGETNDGPDGLSLDFSDDFSSDGEKKIVESAFDEPIPTQAEISTASLSKPAQLMEEIDDEIIEIFMEEAEEEHANISRLLPAWISNTDDEETLKELRRSFHTLKGSGRLVGAVDIGEFAWAYESMLNRVIDKTIEPSETMFDVMRRGQQTLPELFGLFKTADKPDQRILALMEYAGAISQGKEVVLETGIPQEQNEPAEPETHNEVLITETDTDTEQGNEPEEVSLDEDDVLPADVPLPDIDPVLLDIYRKEVETHLATLQNYINDWHNETNRDASNELLRALHTLTGSSRTTGVTQVSELCSLAEKLVKDLQQYHLPLDEAAVSLLQEIHDFVALTSSLLDQVGAELPSSEALTISVQNLLDILHSESPTVEIKLSDLEMHPADQAVSSAESLLNEPDVQLVEPQTPPAAEQATVEYDEELLEIFIEEAEEILDESDNTLHQWVASPEDAEPVEAMQRQLHTLKGGARMAGVMPIGDLGHSIESMLTAVVDGHQPVSQIMFELLQKSQDRLVAMLEQVKDHHAPAHANDLIIQVDSLLGKNTLGKPVDVTVEPIDAPAEEASGATAEEALLGIVPELEQVADALVEKPAADTSVDEVALTDIAADAALTADEPVSVDIPAATEAEQTHFPQFNETALEEEDDGSRNRRKAPRVQQEQVRVRADLLDNLVNFAGEVSIYRSRMEQQSNSFRFNLQELDDTVSRLRDQLRQFEIETEAQIQYRQEETLTQAHEEFDPLEFDRFTHMQHLSRGMLESLSDLDSIRNILAGVTRESETLLLQQSRVNTELQEGLMRTRMVPFSGQAPRLRRIVRQTSEELKKNVELRLHGVDNELDRSVLERIIPPIEHMLRNAIAHGIEHPEQRVAAGKKETGVISLSFGREGSDIIIRIMDDGAGINLKAIHKKAIERGLLQPGAKVSKDMLLNMIMDSGFSTAEEVTQISGRGVGMDVVNTEIKQLGGLFEIDTQEGKGTSFTVSLPLTLAISRALMVNVGDDTYAIPLLSVQSVERLNATELNELKAMDKPVYKWLEEDYPLLHLGTIMGVHAASRYEEGEKVPLLLVRSGDYRAAIQVEALIGSREIVVKPVGPQLSTLRGVSGATIMGDGNVVLIIDPAVMIRLALSQEGEGVIDFTQEKAVEAHTKPVVMVVDDSITVRKVTSRLLERHDYDIMAAKDGVDALAQLQDRVPDVMLLDVEMPRMDGFELATNIRKDDRLQHIPIIMITSRTGQKHRDRALDIGVNHYMGKPFNDTVLLDNIKSLLES